MDFKVPQNSVILYGRPLFDELPELELVSYDYEDILRHAFYNLNTSFKLENVEASMNRFTKGVFKFAFLLCVYFDELFKDTSIVDITSNISELVKDEKIDPYLYETILSCVKYRRGIQFSEEFSTLRKKFIVYCFFLLVEGKLWKKYEWGEIIEFCHTTYKGLNSLEDIARRERKKILFKK